MQNYVICSKHFHSGKPSKAMDETNIWVLTLHLGHDKCQQSSQSTQLQVERSDRARKRAERQWQAEEEQLVLSEVISTANNEIVDETVGELINEIGFDVFQLFEIEAAAMELVTERIMIEEFSISSKEISIKDLVKEEVRSAMLTFTCTEGSCQCADEVTRLKKELQKCHEIIQELSSKLELHLPPFCEESLKDDSIVSFYTGLPNLKVLKAIFNHVCITLPGERSAQCKLTKFQEFMVVMLKLRINPPLVDLSYRSNVSPSTVSRILHKWITQMDIRLKGLIIWPERENLQKTMPNCFRLSFGKKVAIALRSFWNDHLI